jgi:hypothetical protein
MHPALASKKDTSKITLIRCQWAPGWKLYETYLYRYRHRFPSFSLKLQAALFHSHTLFVPARQQHVHVPPLPLYHSSLPRLPLPKHRCLVGGEGRPRVHVNQGQRPATCAHERRGCRAAGACGCAQRFCVSAHITQCCSCARAWVS